MNGQRNPAPVPASDGSKLRVALICGAMTLGMLGVSFAAVPLYQLFCQVTGYAGTTQRADDITAGVLERTIVVRFDANTDRGLDWAFEPNQRSVTVPIGAKTQISYRAQNLGAGASYGTATFNVSPPQAGAYFNKIECFCFTEQKLDAGASMDMPVVFFVDPDIVEDPLLKDTDAITLSYTFFADEAAQSEAETARLAKPNELKL